MKLLKVQVSSGVAEQRAFNDEETWARTAQHIQHDPADAARVCSSRIVSKQGRTGSAASQRIEAITRHLSESSEMVVKVRGLLSGLI